MTIAKLTRIWRVSENAYRYTVRFGEGQSTIFLISGATNSGKSSLLNALAEYIGQEEQSDHDRGFSGTPACFM
ncbi:MAG: hypothetical protein ACLVIY_14325 [Anaerobutyricum soehngenii]